MLWRLFAAAAPRAASPSPASPRSAGRCTAAPQAPSSTRCSTSRARPGASTRCWRPSSASTASRSGPVLFLREWGLTLQSPLPRRGKGHKLALIRDMLSLYDDLPFVLLGDSGQRDPDIYAQVVRENPGRVLAIYIRNVRSDPQRVGAIERTGGGGSRRRQHPAAGRRQRGDRPARASASASSIINASPRCAANAKRRRKPRAQRQPATEVIRHVEGSGTGAAQAAVAHAALQRVLDRRRPTVRHRLSGRVRARGAAGRCHPAPQVTPATPIRTPRPAPGPSLPGGSSTPARRRRGRARLSPAASAARPARQRRRRRAQDRPSPG